MNKKAIGALALVASAGFAHAGVILAPGTVVSNTLGQYGNGFPPISAMLNQSGLSANYVNGVTDFGTFTSSGVTHSGGDSNSWLSSESVFSGSIVFDLGASYNVTRFVMWNGASGINASVNNFGFTTSSVADFSTSTAVGAFVGQQSNYGATVYDLTDSLARYVRFDIRGNFGNGCCIAIGDIAFEVSDAGNQVPEPGTLALVGLSLLGAGVARRKWAA